MSTPDSNETEDRPSAEGRRSNLKRLLLLVARIVGTAVLCGWVLTLVDWAAFWTSVRASNFWIIACAIPLKFLGVWISAIRWRKLLGLHGLKYALSDLTKWCLISMWLSGFLPTSIGGDGYRIFKTWTNGKGRIYSVGAILADRGAGMIGLFVLGFLASVIVSSRTGNPLATTFALAAGAALAVGLPLLWLAMRSGLIERVMNARRSPKLVKALGRLVVDFRNNPSDVLAALGLSVVFHLVRVFGIWLTLTAVGASMDYVTLIFASVAVEVAGMLPISLGGLGLMEGSFIFVAGQFGVASEMALAVILLNRVLNMLVSLSGAWFYVADGRGRRDAAGELDKLCA